MFQIALGSSLVRSATVPGRVHASRPIARISEPLKPIAGHSSGGGASGSSGGPLVYPLYRSCAALIALWTPYRACDRVWHRTYLPYFLKIERERERAD
jgi:hypothetical protein